MEHEEQLEVFNSIVADDYTGHVHWSPDGYRVVMPAWCFCSWAGDEGHDGIAHRHADETTYLDA